MNFEDWLAEVHRKHEVLSTEVEKYLRMRIDEYCRSLTSIVPPVLNVLGMSHRTKSIDDIFEKIKRKGYDSPQSQLTDISGVRVITFSNSQVERVGQLIKSEFKVDLQNSIDKSDDLENDRVGYQSVHYACELGPIQTSRVEFAGLGGLKFEVQVRTVLQHAWAELAHDSTYNLRTVPPDGFVRRLNLISGLLEIADSSLETLANDLARHGNKIISDISDGPLDQVALAPFAIDNFMRLRMHKLDLNIQSYSEKLPESLIREMELFGLKSLGDFDQLISPGVERVWSNHFFPISYRRFARLAMICSDVKLYFTKCVTPGDFAISDATKATLIRALGDSLVAQIPMPFFKDPSNLPAF